MNAVSALAAVSLLTLSAAQIPDTAQTPAHLYRQGFVAHRAKNLVVAELFYRRAIDAWLKEGNQLEAARIRNNLGLLWETQGKIAEAEHSYQDALAIEEKTPGAYGDAADTLQLYARLLRSTNRASEATTQESRAAALREEHIRTILAGDDYHESEAAPVPEGRPVPGGGITGPLNDGVYRTGFIKHAVLIKKVMPSFSDLARLAGVSGTVTLKAIIGTDGRPQIIGVNKWLGLGLDEEAVEAVTKWRYEPTERLGQPVAVVTKIDINFNLQKQ